MENLVNDDLDPSSSDESDNEFDNGSANGKGYNCILIIINKSLMYGQNGAIH